MKYKFKDGYIITNNKGNTYFGNTAHNTMHIAYELCRKFKTDFNKTLLKVIKVYNERTKEQHCDT